MHSDWSTAHFFHSGDEYYQSIIEGIRHSEKLIVIESYIFSIDPLTNIILEELGAAVRRGVHVHLLVDGFGSYTWLDSIEQSCLERGIQFRIYHPIPHNIKWFELFSIRHLLLLAKIVRKLNRRNHRKIVLIDDKRLWLGSLNFTQEHSESIMGQRAWRDSGVYLEGTAINDVKLAHNYVWSDSEREKLFQKFLRLSTTQKPLIPSKNIRINYSRRMRYNLYRELIQRINSAQFRISIVSAYFLPKRSFVRALIRAQKRGCKIQIIVPGISDVPLVKMAAYNMTKWLLKRHIQFFEYQNRVLHAKYMIIDNWTSLGSMNLNHRSMIHDLEIEAVFYNQLFSENIIKQFEVDLTNSKEIQLESLKQQSWHYRFLARIAFAFRYLL